MSPDKLKKGSTRPEPVTSDEVRLYSCPFCPYAHRIRLLLTAKKIPHEIVNIDLFDKPEWISEINPTGLIPILELKDQIVVESLDIADFLEEKYPEPSLYSKDPEEKNKEKVLIQSFGKVIDQMFPAYKGVDGLENLKVEISNFIDELSSELKSRQTTFLNGSSPGMVEYMIYPWILRMEVPFVYNGVEFKLPEGDSSDIFKAWKDALTESVAVKDTPSHMDTYMEAVKIKFPR